MCSAVHVVACVASISTTEWRPVRSAWWATRRAASRMTLCRVLSSSSAEVAHSSGAFGGFRSDDLYT